MNALMATNTLNTQPAAAPDAAGTRAADGQGRPTSDGFTPETARRHIGLHAMATEGLRVPAEPFDIDTDGMPHAIVLAIAAGIQVWGRVQTHGPDGVRSIEDARQLRIMLGALAGRFHGLAHDTLSTQQGVSLREIAEIRMGIRHRNGNIRREWA